MPFQRMPPILNWSLSSAALLGQLLPLLLRHLLLPLDFLGLAPLFLYLINNTFPFGFRPEFLRRTVQIHRDLLSDLCGTDSDENLK